MSDFSRDVRLLESLQSALAGRGYRVDEPWRQGRMASGWISMASPVAHVRVTADRGQWFVEIGPVDDAMIWFDLEQWSACLGAPVSFHTTARSLETEDVAAALGASWRLQPQVSWLERHLDVIEAACAPEARSSTLECLGLAGGRR